LLLAGAGVAWWKIAYPTFSYRVRFVVEIDVDGATKVGSSVIEVRGKKQPTFGNAPPILYLVYGDAVFVDLGQGRNVIATFAFGPNANDDIFDTLAPRLFRMSAEQIALTLSGTDEKVELPLDLIPALVTFEDLNNPRTARVVAPNDFPAVFGAGIRFRRAFIQITSAPVSRDIEAKLPWLRDFKGFLAGTAFDATWSRPSRNLTASYFIKEG